VATLYTSLSTLAQKLSYRCWSKRCYIPGLLHCHIQFGTFHNFLPFGSGGPKTEEQ